MSILVSVPRRLALLLALVVAATCLPAVCSAAAQASAGCPDIDAAPSVVGTQRATAAVGCLVNHERGAAGLGSVRIDARATAAAQRFADDMVSGGFFSHDSPNGDDPGARLLAAGLDWLAFGENLARGQQTPREAVTAWLASPEHCETLMTPMFTGAGYGIAASPSGPYWVQEFVRPVDLGVMSRFVPTPRCPRAPVPFAAPAGQPAGAVQDAPRVRLASVSRSGRVVRARLVLTGVGGRVSIRVQVRRGGRTVRALTLRRPAGTTRVTLRLPTARPGRLVVRAGSGTTVSRAFR